MKSENEYIDMMRDTQPSWMKDGHGIRGPQPAEEPQRQFSWGDIGTGRATRQEQAPDSGGD